jgi:hypothetical protein
MHIVYLVQVAYHASRALLQYIRAHLLIHLTALQRRLRDGPVRVATHTASLLCCCFPRAPQSVLQLLMLQTMH